MQKDYWNISRRDFNALGGVAVFFFLIFVLIAFMGSSVVASKTALLFPLGYFLVTAILFFVIANLFKKRSPKAIIVSYVYLTIALILSIINNFILSPAANGLLFKAIGLLILIYLLVNTRKASKQTI